MDCILPEGFARRLPSLDNIIGDVRSEQEARQYFSGLSLDPAKECILIKVGSSIISRHLDSLVSALALLSRIRIYPIVVHEAVSPIDTIAQVTDASMLALTRSVLLGANLELVEALENSETRARPITSGVFEAEYLDKRQYGLVGKIKAVDLRAIKRSIAEYCIPVLVLMGETPDGQILEVNGIRELANSLQPRKIILLSEDGGVFSMDKNERISVIKIEESHAQQIHDSDREKIREYEELLNNQPGTSEIRILRPVDLVRGLFVDEVVGTTIIKSKTSTFE
ncbi:hypothetical protein MMC12_006236 [Toensbergia leucococca]|nr:hypothetical protein [Toensbergia leucococca]